jgi:cell filamentation protein
MTTEAEERRRRRSGIDFARGSVRLEGIVLDGAIEALNQRFAAGDINGPQHVRLSLEYLDAKHANPPDQPPTIGPTRGEACSFLRILELELAPLPGRFDAHHLKAIHGHIFQDSPPHRPGEYRPENPRGVYVKNRALEAEPTRYHVCYRTEGIAAAVDSAIKGFGAVETLRDLGVEEMARKLAGFYGDLDHAHPFCEGNSRTLRAFTRQMARQAGWELDWGAPHANAASRDALYIARDLAVTARAFPGLDQDRAMQTSDRMEYEAWVMFTSRYRARPTLETLIRSALTRLT